MDFEFEGGVDAHDQVVEGHAEVAVDLEFHHVEMLHAVVGGIVRVHVDVGLGADDAFVHFEVTVGAHQHAAGSAGDVARHLGGDVEAERDGVGEGEFDLVQVAAGAEEAKVRDHAAARSNESDGFLSGVLAVLIEALHRSQLMTRTEEGFDSLLGEVGVTGGDVYQQSVGRLGLLGQGKAHLGVNLLADHVLDDGTWGR